MAVLIEPIQGEAGVLVPPAGYLRGVREICDPHDVLLIADEIQAGLGRTGTMFACDHEDVVPDLYVLGKALGGGIVPVSADRRRPGRDGRAQPGQHGSTFGGNPLACAVGMPSCELLETGEFQARSRELGAQLHRLLARLPASQSRRCAAEGCGRGCNWLPASRARA